MRTWEGICYGYRSSEARKATLAGHISTAIWCKGRAPRLHCRRSQQDGPAAQQTESHRTDSKGTLPRDLPSSHLLNFNPRHQCPEAQILQEHTTQRDPELLIHCSLHQLHLITCLRSSDRSLLTGAHGQPSPARTCSNNPRLLPSLSGKWISQSLRDISYVQGLQTGWIWFSLHAYSHL